MFPTNDSHAEVTYTKATPEEKNRFRVKDALLKARREPVAPVAPRPSTLTPEMIRTRLQQLGI